MSEPPAHPLVALRPGDAPILLGNHAIVRGALEAGVAVATAYPGTPSSEIADAFEAIASTTDIYFEYSTNEKVALEVGGAAAYSGARTLVSMKHVGLNVALEPLMSLAYTGVPGGLVIISADEPGCHSSQNEQDNRLVARLANLPCLEPADADEARRLTIRAFELSERFELPVILRTTTRLNHSRGVVDVGELAEPVGPTGFKSDFRRYVTMPPISLQRHGALLDSMGAVESAVDHIEELVEFNPGHASFGIVSSGVCRNYVHDALLELSASEVTAHLQLAVTHPLPRQRCIDALRELDRVLVVEQLEPIVENTLKTWVADHDLDVQIVGKGFGEMTRLGEYHPDAVLRTVAEFLEFPVSRPPAPEVEPIELPGRPPALCAGCPHRASFYALKVAAGDDAIFAGDIGCYTLGGLDPFNMQDTLLCMGASTSTAAGLSLTNPDRPVVATIGDSTFFHSGIAGLVNAVRNGHNYTLAILDNSTTAMTGHQPHPASDDGGRPRVSIEQVVRAIGVDNIEVVDPMNLPEITETARRSVEHPGVSVMICREPCPLYQRAVDGPPEERVVYQVDKDRCKSCGFAAQGLHCNVEIKQPTQLWRSNRKLEHLQDHGTTPVRESVPPCSEGCPVNICVHGYVAHVAAGEYAAALRTIRERNPLPSVCSRVCHQPCEIACRRSDYDAAVEINRLKRFVCDWASEHPDQVPPPDVQITRDEQVAVIGSGPCGLACAHDLALRGYSVTVFDQMPAPGGLLRYGIPPYRLPHDVLDRDLDWLAELGVEFRCSVEIGNDITLPELADRGFDAFFIATGAWTPDIPQTLRSEADGVRDALTFLQNINRLDNQKRLSELTGNSAPRPVVVIGGGNTGIDAARASLRLGHSDVTVIERDSRCGCSAIPEELHAAEAEGVDFLFGADVRELLVEDQQISAVRVSVADSATVSIPADVVLVATGQRLDPLTVQQLGLTDTDDGWLATDDAGATQLPGVFAAGDAVDGPGSVIEVIAAGRRLAHRIDKYLAGSDRTVAPLHFHDPEFSDDDAEYRPDKLPNIPPREPVRPAEPTDSFAPPERTLTERQARLEANRCIGCGSCANCNVCIDEFACVAIWRDDNGRVRVNPSLCNGCGVCAQLCPNNAYERVVLEGT